MQRGDPPALAVPRSFRDADALIVASPLCSDPVEMFPEAVTLRGGEKLPSGGWRLDKDQQPRNQTVAWTVGNPYSC